MKIYSLPNVPPRAGSRLRVRGYAFVAALLVLLALPNERVRADVQVQQLSPSAASPQPVGTKVTWAASATDTNSGTLEYRFSVQPPGGDFAVVRDFAASGSFEWTPSDREGSFNIRVAVRNALTKETVQQDAAYDVSTRVTGDAPVVSGTGNPLVAFYSAPACAAGKMRVRFWKDGDPVSRHTLWKPCRPGVSMNFYIAGMLAATQYSIRHEVRVDDAHLDTGPTLSFLTGEPPAGRIPVPSVVIPYPGYSGQDVLINANAAGLKATDLSGRLLWYYDRPVFFVTRPVEGGNMFVMVASATSANVLREIDLAGNTVRETNIGAVSEQLLARGAHAITGFHHEAGLLPNGNTFVLAATERVMSDVQGPGPVTILGDMILVLDKDWQVVWSWDAFDHLNVFRAALLDEKCTFPSPSCPTTASAANDWLHSNSVAYTPDGNLLLSMRHQDWVIKIDYRDGGGTGDVLWRLGKDGDFAIESDDIYPWFSHQHDVEFEPGAGQTISLYDNGNLRQFISGVPRNSRGQVLSVDEEHRKVSPLLNADLGGYSFALGSAQRLKDGSYHFNSGFLPGNVSRAIEVSPGGSAKFALQLDGTNYRSFRVRDLYIPSDTEGDQSINFAAVADKTFGEAPFAVSATAASGLPVSLQVISGPATVAGDTVTLTGVGTVVLQADQYGDTMFEQAQSVRRSFVVKQTNQITFAPLADKTFGDADFNPGAVASSGLAVSYSVTGNCTVSGSTVHLTGAGSCTVTASQAGDSNFNAAADVQRSFQIAKAATATSLASSANPSALGRSVTFTAAVTSPAGTPTGTVTFKEGVTTLGTGTLDGSGLATLATSTLAAGAHVVTAEYGGGADFNTSSGTLSGVQTVGSVFEFSQANYTAAERGGSVTITVTRTGITTQASAVDYVTDDGDSPSDFVPCSATVGLASERCDYERATGTLRFAADETQKTFDILISDDSYVEGVETLTLRLVNPADGAGLGARFASTLQITDDAAESAGNPVDENSFFVRQQYRDFLNREPDAEGLAFWTGQMADCGSPDPQVCRVNVSAAFFLSIEFKETGFLVERLYKAAYGDATGTSILGGAHQLSVPVVRLSEFRPDTQQIGQNVVVGVGDWQGQLDTNKRAFFLQFVQRQRFRDAFPATMAAADFVAKLDQNAGGVLTAAEKADLIASLAPDPSDAAQRAHVLRSVAESAALARAETNRAFVLMQYFGYLRRNPTDAPEAGLDYTGYDFWLTKLNQFGGNFVQAEMVKAFLDAGEYRNRFGQ